MKTRSCIMKHLYFNRHHTYYSTTLYYSMNARIKIISQYIYSFLAQCELFREHFHYTLIYYLIPLYIVKKMMTKQKL